MLNKQMNIILIGHMGTGKTTVGKQLSKTLNKPFIDIDQYIEKKTGVKIPLIFEYEGEVGFRSRESRALEELANYSNSIFATGGGIVLLKKNRDALSRLGVIFYLNTDSNTLCERLKSDKKRPLLANVDINEKINTLFKERNSLYESISDFIIDTKQKKIVNIVSEILEKMKLK